MSDDLTKRDVGLDLLPPSYIRGCKQVKRRKQKIKAAKLRISLIASQSKNKSIIRSCTSGLSLDIPDDGIESDYGNGRRKRRKKNNGEMDREDFSRWLTYGLNYTVFSNEVPSDKDITLQMRGYRTLRIRWQLLQIGYLGVCFYQQISFGVYIYQRNGDPRLLMTVLELRPKYKSFAPLPGWLQRIHNGRIMVDGDIVTDPDVSLRAGSELVYHRLPWREPDPPYLLEVLYEDGEMLAVNMPSRLSKVLSDMWKIGKSDSD